MEANEQRTVNGEQSGRTEEAKIRVGLERVSFVEVALGESIWD